MLVNEKKCLPSTSGFIHWRCFAIQKQLKATGLCDQNESDYSFKKGTDLRLVVTNAHIFLSCHVTGHTATQMSTQSTAT